MGNHRHALNNAPDEEGMRKKSVDVCGVVIGRHNVQGLQNELRKFINVRRTEQFSYKMPVYIIAEHFSYICFLGLLVSVTDGSWHAL